MAAGSIVVDLLMRTGSFETDTGRAEKRLKQFEKNVVDAGTRIATGVGAIAAAIGGSIAIVDQFAQSIGQYQDIADKIGDTASAVSSLQLAADLSGTALDTVAAASVKLTAALAKTDDESDAVAKALAAINIPLDQFKALSPVEQIDRVARALAEFEDGAGKTAVAVALFGRSGAEIIPFLNDLADAQQRNVLLTDEQIAAADEFSKTLATMRSELATAAKVVASELIPSFQAFLDYVKDTEVGTRLLSAAGAVLRTVFETLAVVAANVAFVFVGVGREIGAIAAQMAALARLDINGFNAISVAVKQDAARARAELDAFEKRILSLRNQAPVVPGEQSPAESRRFGFTKPAIAFEPAATNAPRSRSLGSASAPRQSEADRYLESLQRQLERTKDLTVTEQLLTDIQAGRLGKVNAATQSALVGLAEQIDAAKRLEDQLRAEDQQMRDLKASQEALREAGAAVFEATRTPIEKLGQEQARLNELLQKGAIDWDTYARAVFAAQDSYERAAASAGDASKTVDTFSKQFAENTQSQLGQGLFDLMNGNFKNIGDGFTQMVQRMVAEALAADIARALFGDLLEGGSGKGVFGEILGGFKNLIGGMSSSAPAAGGGASGGGSLLSSLFSFAGSFFGGSFAQGGDVIAGRPVLVGELGPEMFVPRTMGAILPSNKTTNSRSVVNNISVMVPQNTNRSTGAQIGADIARRLAINNVRGN